MIVLTLLSPGCSKPEEVINARIKLANQKLEAGKAGEAVSILEKIVVDYPDTASIHEALGYAYAQAGNQGAAGKEFSKAADLDPASTNLREFAAEAFLRDGSPTRAAEQHRLYLAEFPGDYDARDKLGDTEMQQGNIARAIDAYLECHRVRPDGASAYKIGDAFYKIGNLPQARSWFEQTIRHGDSHIDKALVGLLTIERQSQDFGAAEKTLGQIQRNFPKALDPAEVETINTELAAWHEREKGIEEARAQQEKLAREFEEESIRKRQEAIDARPDVNEPARAVSESATPIPASSSTAAAPDSTAAPAVENAPAAVAPTTAVTPDKIVTAPLPPGEPLPPELAAAIEIKHNGDPAKAADMISTLLSSDDSRLELWTELADCYRQLKQYDAAEAYILEARRRAPDSIEIETAFLNIVHEAESGDIYLMRLDEARHHFPDNVNLAYMLAHELSASNVSASRTTAAYEDFLMLAAPTDPRRTEASNYLARARRQ